ncbi:MAG: 50S ribosomal protein L32 [Anaerolineae bacterium]
MPPQPKRKLSKARRDRRRAHDALPAIHLIRCPKCGALRQPHRICPECGTYKGETFIETKEEKK